MIEKHLKELGLYRIESHLDELYRRAKEMTFAAGTSSNAPQFAAFPSFIPADSRQPQAGVSLLIDIGGTSTKTGIRRVNSDHREVWETLFETKNREFQIDGVGVASFETYSELLCDAVLSSLEIAGVALSQVQNIGIVWSNALVSERVSDTIISGKMAAKEFYNKGEWFLEGLNEGDDIGAMLRGAFESRGMKLQKFLIANDTPLTFKAARFASSGVVASTGVNGTIVKSLEELGIGNDSTRIICNAQIGDTFRLDSDWLSAGDELDGNRKADQIERMIGGGFLRKILCAYVFALCDLGAEEFVDLASALRAMGEGRWKEFRGTDIGLLVGEDSDITRFMERRSFELEMTDQLASSLRELARALVVRAAKLASVVAFATIANQFERGERLVVSLNSRLAREMPLFWSVMRKEFYSRIPFPAQAELVLVEPIYTSGGSISVPLRGAATALDSLG